MAVSAAKPLVQAVPADQPLVLSALSLTVAIRPVVVNVVYPATPLVPCGEDHPAGTVIVIPPEFIDSAAVKVKLKVLPVELRSAEFGLTVLVPEPSAAKIL